MELLRNGTETKEEILNAGNRWTHTWTGLDPSFHWEVAEKDVPEGYTVSVDRDGYHFTITNKSTEPGNPSPPSGDDPMPDTPAPDTPTDGPLGLPQTGQLWGRFPLLVVVGVPLLLTGAMLFDRKEEPEEFKEPYE